MHAVEGAEQSGLAATGRADERRDLAGGNAHVDVKERLLLAIEKIDLVDVHPHRRRRRRFAA